MKTHFYIKLLSCLLFFVVSCSKNKDNKSDPKPEPEPNPVNTRLKNITATIELPAGTVINGKDLRLSTLFTENNQVVDGKSTIQSVKDSSMEVAFATDAQDNILLLSYFNPADNEPVKLNAESTAIAIIMMHPWTIDLSINGKANVIKQIKALPEFTVFKQKIETSIKKGSLDPLVDKNIIDKLLQALPKSTIARAVTQGTAIGETKEPLAFSVEDRKITIQNILSSASYGVGLYDGDNKLIKDETVSGLEKSKYLVNGMADIYSTENSILKFDVPDADGSYKLVVKSGLSFDDTEENTNGAVANSVIFIGNICGIISPQIEKFVKGKCGLSYGLYVWRTGTRMKTIVTGVKDYSEKKIGLHELMTDIYFTITETYDDIIRQANDCEFGGEEVLKDLKKGSWSKVFKFFDVLSELTSAFNTTAHLTDWLQYDKQIEFEFCKNKTELFRGTCKDTLVEITTQPVKEITNSSATAGGTITKDGGDPITERGICWGAGPEPTVENSVKITAGSGTGSFSIGISKLEEGKTYHVRAYAINSRGVSYGNNEQFTTKKINPPTLTTNAVSAVSATSAVSGGNITNDGGTPITARGVCWSTSPNPTIANTKTIEVGGVGNFTSNIAGLEPDKAYYVRAYATNSKGTGYGNEVELKTEKNNSLIIGKWEIIRAGWMYTLNGTTEYQYYYADDNVSDNLYTRWQFNSDGTYIESWSTNTSSGIDYNNKWRWVIPYNIFKINEGLDIEIMNLTSNELAVKFKDDSEDYAWAVYHLKKLQ